MLGEKLSALPLTAGKAELQTPGLVCSSLFSTHFERLDKSVEKDPDADTPPQQLDEPGSPEELEEADLEVGGGVDDAPHHCYEVKAVPVVFEVVLEIQLKLLVCS